MNLEESNEIYQKNKEKNAKKQTILGAIVLLVVLIVICFIAIGFLKQKEATRFRMIVDGKEATVNPNLIVEDEETKLQYVNIREFAKYVGYKYTKGDYVEVNEDENNCYVENDYEIVTFKLDEKAFSKYAKNNSQSIDDKEDSSKEQTVNEESKTNYIVSSKDGQKSNYTLKNPIKKINDNLCVSADDINVVFNAVMYLEENRLVITSLDQLVKAGQNLAAQYGYDTISSTYENLRAIANNMLVVGKDNEYGVISLSENGNTLLSVRYDDIIYVQNENQFYVTVDSKVGLMDASGKTIISPKEYDSIETFDVEKKLYLVKKDSKYGILDDTGKVILHTDFDAIGISDTDSFPQLAELSNPNIWFDKIVPVKKGTLYGLYNIEDGSEVVGFIYDGFGYKTTSTDVSGEESLILVPRETGKEGVVVEKDDMYGICDINQYDKSVPIACSRIYSISKNGITQYYIHYQQYLLEMREYFESDNKVTVD